MHKHKQYYLTQKTHTQNLHIESFQTVFFLFSLYIKEELHLVYFNILYTSSHSYKFFLLNALLLYALHDIKLINT